MKPEPKQFDKQNPCTKFDLWQCFRGKRGFVRVQIDEAHAIIGLNAPRNMRYHGYVQMVEVRNVEYYELTSLGRAWLMEGFHRYIKAHPERMTEVKYLPK